MTDIDNLRLLAGERAADDPMSAYALDGCADEIERLRAAILAVTYQSDGKDKIMTNPIDTTRLQEWAIGMAKHVAKLSKDPSTQVGAVIFDEKRRLVSTGYNGFARGVEDREARLLDRNTKLKLTLHAEKNAMLFATAPLDGCTMVVTHPCCAQCAAQTVQAGIKHVVWPRPSEDFLSRWADDYAYTLAQFGEAGVEVVEL